MCQKIKYYCAFCGTVTVKKDVEIICRNPVCLLDTVFHLSCSKFCNSCSHPIVCLETLNPCHLYEEKDCNEVA